MFEGFFFSKMEDPMEMFRMNFFFSSLFLSLRQNDEAKFTCHYTRTRALLISG